MNLGRHGSGMLPRTAIVAAMAVAAGLVAWPSPDASSADGTASATVTVSNGEAAPSPASTATPTSTPTPTTPSSAPGPVPVLGGPGGGCEAPRAAVDVDGDGREDAVGEGRDGDELVVCLTSGEDVAVEWLGGHEAFDVLDLDDDGRAEVVYGSTVLFADVQRLARHVDGEFVVVEDRRGDPFELTDGVLGADAGNRPAHTSVWGCADVDGDGVDELVQAVAFREVETWEVTTTVLALDGDRVQVVEETTTDVDWPEDADTFDVQDPSVIAIRPCRRA